MFTARCAVELLVPVNQLAGPLSSIALAPPSMAALASRPPMLKALVMAFTPVRAVLASSVPELKRKEPKPSESLLPMRICPAAALPAEPS